MVLSRLLSRSTRAPGEAIAAGPRSAPQSPFRMMDGRTLQPAVASGIRYELGIDSFFGASHAMRPTGERHTHSFRVQASFVTDTVDANGMVVGFREVSNLLDAEAKRYTGRFLNEIEPFTRIQATGENLATVIFRNLMAALAEQIPDGPGLVAVTLWENPTSYVRVQLQEAA